MFITVGWQWGDKSGFAVSVSVNRDVDAADIRCERLPPPVTPDDVIALIAEEIRTQWPKIAGPVAGMTDPHQKGPR